MNIIPIPKSIEYYDGFYRIRNRMCIAIDEHFCENVNMHAFDFKNILKERLSLDILITRIRADLFGEYDIVVLYNSKYAPENYSLIISKERICIEASEHSGVMYAFKTLEEIIDEYKTELPCVKIFDFPSFKNRGFYYDVTRGKVPKLQTLELLADKAAKYKLNQLQLYIEHTFAYKNMSEVWRGSDCLTAEDILKFDKYCKDRNIELIPSFATFGHMYHILKSYSFSDLCEYNNCEDKPYSWFDRQIHYTIDPTNPQSIELVRKIINETAPLFSSNKYNICCDETYDLGKEKSKKYADEIGVGRLYLEFFNKICECVKENNKTPMCWCDIILNHKELIHEIPKDVTFMTWGYSGPANEERIKTIAESGHEFYVCPGVSGWNRLINDIELSNLNISTTAQFGKRYGADGILNTDWGDFGHINSLLTSIPGLIIGASYAWNTENVPSYKDISKVEYSDCSEKTIELIAELSEAECFNWADFISFKEQSNGYDNDVLKPWVTKEFSDNISFDKLNNSYNKAIEIKEKFDEIKLSTNQEFPYSSFSMLAEGVALFNALFVVIKIREFDKKGEPIITPYELASRLEYWMSDFEKDWRIFNRESELFRIRKNVFWACDYLRKA